MVLGLLVEVVWGTCKALYYGTSWLIYGSADSPNEVLKQRVKRLERQVDRFERQVDRFEGKAYRETKGK